MNITLTGAAGNLGSVVCRKLVESGYTVHATDISYRSDLPVKIDVADLLDISSCYRVLESAEAVVHLANHPSFQGREAQRIHNENVSMNFNIFEAARQMGIKNIIFSSSVQVFVGDRHWDEKKETESSLPYLPVDGNVPPLPGNPYAISKNAAEITLRYLSRHWGMNCTALRFPFLIDPEWLEHIREHRKRHGRSGPWPGQNIDEVFTYLLMTDAASLIDAILRAKLTGFRTYFPVALDHSVETPVSEMIAKYFPKVPLRIPAGEIKHLVDISAITNDTGWTPVRVLG
ncbi:MAG: NAD(P)-dependent oxidoreductase [Spirochaetes bacterium]|nr:NAD(P)-dependent oxidoreductase [Spirochaetota bacterium]